METGGEEIKKPEQKKEEEISLDFKLWKEVVAQQIAQTSKQLKNQLKNDEGDTYLLEIDTYLWFSEARNYLRHGHLGDKINEQGHSVYSLRNGRMEKVVNKNLNPYVGA